MRTLAGPAAFCLSIVTTLVCIVSGVANALASGAEPALATKFMQARADVLLGDGHLDVHAMNAALRARGEPGIENEEFSPSLAAWLAQPLRDRAIKRHHEGRTVSFVAAGLSAAVTVLIWVARPGRAAGDATAAA